MHRNIRYLPSVYQIRYRGYKGVLTLSSALTGATLVHFRSSMRKFNEAKDCSLSIIDHSKVSTIQKKKKKKKHELFINVTPQPYCFGYLNDEIILLLLHALGITTETLL